MASSLEHTEDLSAATASRAGRPPLTANPAFPWIVALWFAALLGIGSLILPTGLLELATTASGLATILPMAAPPLGTTAQGLLALCGTFAGGALGLFLARRIASSGDAGSSWLDQPDRADASPEGEYLGEDDIGGLPAAAAGRRRPLTMSDLEETGEFLDLAPLPVAHRHVADTPAIDWHRLEEANSEDATGEEPPARADGTPDLDAAHTQLREWPPAETLEEEYELTKSQSGEDLEAEAAEIEPQERLAQGSAPAPSFDLAQEAPASGPVTAKEPLLFSPPSMAREGDGNDQVCFSTPEVRITPSDDAAPDSEDLVPDEPANEHRDPSAGESEGLVQLVQRLEATLQKRRQWAAERAARKPELASAGASAAREMPIHKEPVPGATLPGDFEQAGPDDVYRAMAAYFGSPARTSATGNDAGPAGEKRAPGEPLHTVSPSLATLAFDNEDEAHVDDEPAGHLAPSAVPRPAPRPVETSPLPAKPPASNDEHERVLREALMNLQRMNGTL